MAGDLHKQTQIQALIGQQLNLLTAQLLQEQLIQLVIQQLLHLKQVNSNRENYEILRPI